uniref:Cytochrome P450 n=1 Tax=Brassica oleracea var. oleracea TaxID=109376 RepID=A0A0D3BJG3_BRAOL
MEEGEEIVYPKKATDGIKRLPSSSPPPLPTSLLASIGLFEASIFLFCFLIFYYFLVNKHYGNLLIKKYLQRCPWNWPVLRMLPAVLMRFNRIDDAISIIEKTNLTFLFKGLWFSRIYALITVDPDNIHHILTSNFSNYVKGPEFKEIFDVYGDAIFNPDGELWKNLRMSFQVILHQQVAIQRKGQSWTCMISIRFMFDISLISITGSDPQSLSIEMPEVEFAKAFNNAGEAILFRNFIPRFLWKFQRWMGLGQEKMLLEAGVTFDRICEKYIDAKREEIRSQGIDHDHSNGESEDVLTSYIKLDTSKYELLDPSNDKFIGETLLSFIFAGRDTTATAITWFFGLLTKTLTWKPRFAKKSPQIYWKLFKSALYEAVRIYPPIPFERKSPIKSDVLPSGYKIDANSNIIISIYALGRMRSVWGEDAWEFKPEMDFKDWRVQT